MKKLLLGFVLGALVGIASVFVAIKLFFPPKIETTAYLIDLIKDGASLDEVKKMVQKMGLIVIHERDENLRTPLWYAVQKGNVDVASYLLDEGADIIDHDFMNTNQFMVASETGVDVLKLLYMKNESINSIDKNGNTPLMYAAKSGNMGTVSFLVEKNANVLQKNYAGKTAKEIAKESGHTKIVEFLEKKEDKASKGEK